MSRTIRKLSTTNCHRNFKNMNFRKVEQSALDALIDSDIKPRNRHKNYWSQIPDVWIDFPVSANSEGILKVYWKQYVYDKYNVPKVHFTKNK